MIHSNTLFTYQIFTIFVPYTIIKHQNIKID